MDNSTPGLLSLIHSKGFFFNLCVQLLVQLQEPNVARVPCLCFTRIQRKRESSTSMELLLGAREGTAGDCEQEGGREKEKVAIESGGFALWERSQSNYRQQCKSGFFSWAKFHISSVSSLLSLLCYTLSLFLSSSCCRWMAGIGRSCNRTHAILQRMRRNHSPLYNSILPIEHQNPVTSTWVQLGLGQI